LKDLSWNEEDGDEEGWPRKRQRRNTGHHVGPRVGTWKKQKHFEIFIYFWVLMGKGTLTGLFLWLFSGWGGPFYFTPKDLRGNIEELAKEGILNTLRPPLDNVDYLFPLPLDHNHSPTKHLLTWWRYACKANT